MEEKTTSYGELQIKSSLLQDVGWEHIMQICTAGSLEWLWAEEVTI